MERSRNGRRRLGRGLAGWVLLAGLLGTIVLWGKPGPEETASPMAQEALPPLGPGDFKKSAREMEVLGGRTLVVLEGWQRRLTALGRENALALLVAGGSLALAGLLFWLGGPPQQPPSRPESPKNAP